MDVTTIRRAEFIEQETLITLANDLAVRALSRRKFAIRELDAARRNDLS